MDVEFCSSDPVALAGPSLDAMLEQGTDQVMIASAYCSNAGLTALAPHATRLKKPGSFVVVAWDGVTMQSLVALDQLNKLIRGNLRIHLGVLTPEEKRVGCALMHSKVYFARSGEDAWLWTGSHNLTNNALRGGNAEAAIMITGTMSDQPIKDAVKHLETVAAEAVPYREFAASRSWGPQSTLVVHVESDIQDIALGSFIHLRSVEETLDGALIPGSVWLFIHKRDSLSVSAPRPSPQSAYSGVSTGLVHTELHANPGIEGTFDRADYVVYQEGPGGKFIMSRHDGGDLPKARTQAVFRVDHKEKESTVWLREKPRAKFERSDIETTKSSERVDARFAEFFTPESIDDEGYLVRRSYSRLQQTYRAPVRDFGAMDRERLSDVVDDRHLLDLDSIRSRLSLAESVNITPAPFEYKGLSNLIYRARYRVDPK